MNRDQKNSKRIIFTNGGNESWWNLLQQAKTNKDKTGTWGGNKQVKITSWVSTNQEHYKKGSLSSNQIKALKDIGFNFNDFGRRRKLENKPLTGESVHFLALKEKFDASQGQISQEDEAEFKRLQSKYLSKYRGGLLSEITAKKLGLI